MKNTNEWIGWKSFHPQIDIATAIWIGEGKVFEPRLPSEITLMDFLDFVFSKTQEKKPNETKRILENLLFLVDMITERNKDVKCFVDGRTEYEEAKIFKDKFR